MATVWENGEEVEQTKQKEKKMTEKKAKAVEEKVKVAFVENDTYTNLKCALTPDEVMTQAEEMARLQQEIASKEAEASSVNKRYKSEIEALVCQQDVSAGLIRDKFQYRSVRCMKRVNFDTKIVTVTRLDTGETVETRDITASEAQMQMKLEADKEAQECMVKDSDEV